jgi:hypothetical protein
LSCRHLACQTCRVGIQPAGRAWGVSPMSPTDGTRCVPTTWQTGCLPHAAAAVRPAPRHLHLIAVADNFLDAL